MKRFELPGINPDSKKPIRGLIQLSSRFDVKYWIKIFAAIVCFFSVNFVAASTLWGGQDIFTNWSSARLLFFKGIIPYSQNGVELLTKSANNWHVIPKDTDISFINPLFSLFLFFPFSLTHHFFLVRAFWLIINEVLLFLSGRLVLRIVGFQDDQIIRRKILFYFISIFSSVIALLQGSDYIFLFFIFLCALQCLQEKKFRETGVLCAFLTFKPQALFPLLIALFIYLIYKKGWSAFIWFFISTSILVIAINLFVHDWTGMYFRAIITNGAASGVALPGELIKNWIKDSPPLIWNGISAICIGVILLELYLSSMNSKRLFWVLCLLISLLPLIMIQNRLSALCFLLLPMSYTCYHWIERNLQIGIWVLNFTVFLFSFVLLILGIVTKSMDYQKDFSAVFYFLPVAYSILNLYWVRGWVKNELQVQ